jgi:hypothetical protein
VAGDVRAVPRKSRFLEDVRANWRPSAKISALVRDLGALHLAHPQNPRRQRRQDAARGVEEDRMEEEEEVMSVERHHAQGEQRRQQGQGGGGGTAGEENELEGREGEETLRVDMGKSVVFSQA